MKCPICHKKCHEKRHEKAKNKKAGMFYSCSRINCSYKLFVPDERPGGEFIGKIRHD